MRSFDTNNDGVLNPLDTGYIQLKIWQDVNLNGQTDAGELKILSQWNIVSIDIPGAVRDPWAKPLMNAFSVEPSQN